jgi:hypothetical protein
MPTLAIFQLKLYCGITKFRPNIRQQLYITTIACTLTLVKMKKTFNKTYILNMFITNTQ